jgi:hypothetical protein
MFIYYRVGQPTEKFGRDPDLVWEKHEFLKG